MKRLHQSVLIGSSFLASWLGMQTLHECGHVLGAFLTDAEVKRVVLNPLSISRTDLGLNPNPLFVVWAGPIFGVLLPLILWKVVATTRTPGTFVFRFFAGFCWIANGAYIAVGSFDRIGDCGEMLTHGSERWMLWLFGSITIPIGLWLWHDQGSNFGLGSANGAVNWCIAYSTLAACLVLVIFGFSVGGK
jgi:hypothetical protein